MTKPSRPARDTIAAPATAQGGAVAIVRLSGPRSLRILGKIFTPKNKDYARAFPARRPVLGRFVEAGEAFDEGLATWYPAPASFTGEDVVEMSCHGGPAIVEAILRLAAELGARPAQPGEFTRRAFLEGKLDLVQAEAVADLVMAQTRAAAHAALGHLEGRLSRELEAVWERLVEAGAHIEAAIDFPDEFEPGAGPLPADAPMGGDALAALFEGLEATLSGLLESYRAGRILREGARVAILGRPNAGKSTLLNRLLGAERAITSEVPGTTRDTVEEVCEVGGAPVRLIDTAGLRETGDPVEREGTERARAAAAAADLRLMVADITEGEQEIAWVAQESAREAGDSSHNLFVFNKIDAVSPGGTARAREVLRELAPDAAEPVLISALTGEGIARLKERMAGLLTGGRGEAAEVALTRERHRAMVSGCLDAVRRAGESARAGASPELVAVHLNEAQGALAALLGRDYGQALLDAIFATFCIGK